MEETTSTEYKEWDHTTKLLHWLLAAIMTYQMIMGLFTHASYTYLYLHEGGGIAAIIILVIEWMWIFAKGQFSLFFPWAPQAIQPVFVDIKNIFRLKLPSGGSVPGLANFWHGIGLIIFSLMGITGLLLLFNLPSHSIIGVTSQNYELNTQLGLIHITISYVAWVYLGSHILTALIHEFTGDHHLQRMFLFRT